MDHNTKIKIVEDVMEIYKENYTGNLSEDLDLTATMLGPVLCCMGTLVNPSHCVSLILACMRKIEWPVDEIKKPN